MVERASVEVRSGIVYATIIVVLVFVPLFALPGIEGRLFSPLGIAYIVSILASMLVSMTVTPVLCYYLLPKMKRLDHGDSPLVAWLKRGDARLLAWSFPHAKTLIAIAALAVAAAAATVPFFPRAFLPAFNEGSLVLSLMLNPGTSLAEANRIGAVAEGLIGEVPEVTQVGRRTGRAELDEHAEGVHSAEIDVDLKRSDRDREAGHGRHPRQARGAAGAGGHRPADLAPAGPPAVRRARTDRAEDLRRRHRHAARPGRTACARS